MKLFDIKIKITLWYTFFMILLVSGVLYIFVEFTGATILDKQKSELIEVVHDTIEDIEDRDDIKFFDDGVFILLYNEKGKFLDGTAPYGFSLDYPLKEGKIEKKSERDRSQFYIYDKKIQDRGGEEIWVRGVVSDSQTKQLTTTVLRIAFFGLPLLVIISSIIGYLITKRAFLPVKKIQETAENISNSNELSLRINLPYGKDEISKLGATIDKMLERVEQSFKKEKQFTSDASHELRTPITVILAESEYILEHGESLEEAKESMEVIKRQGNRVSALINQLLFLSRVDQGSVRLKRENLDIGKTVAELCEDNRIEASRKNIDIFMENLLHTKEFCLDKLLFIRAIQNILQNGIAYGKRGGFIKVKLFENREYLVVEVEDNGIGIAQDKLNKIWDRFYQVEESRNSKNFGLGLSMVKFIIEQHEGYVEVESSLGFGTTFRLYFKKV